MTPTTLEQIAKHIYENAWYTFELTQLATDDPQGTLRTYEFRSTSETAKYIADLVCGAAYHELLPAGRHRGWSTEGPLHWGWSAEEIAENLGSLEEAHNAMKYQDWQ